MTPSLQPAVSAAAPQYAASGPERLPAMRIMFLTRDLRFGGAQAQLVMLANALSKRGHAVDLVVFYPEGDFKDRLDERIAFLPLNKKGRWDVLSFFYQFRKVVSQRKPDVIYSFLITPNVISALHRLVSSSTPVVWGVRSALNEAPRDHASRLNYFLQRRLSRAADVIIANSNSGRETMRAQNFPVKKIQVVHNGFDLDRFRIDPAAGAAMRETWAVPPRACLVGFVGRLQPVKDPENFIQAAKRVAEKSADAHFVCVGGGQPGYIERLKSLADSLGLAGRFTWAGELAAMPAVYNALDILCSSSYTEGFPNVVGEAMACGVPCVVTDVGESSGIVGDLGITVAPRDPEALAGGLLAMIAQLPIDQAALRKRIADNFDREKMVAAVEGLLVETIEAANGK